MQLFGLARGINLIKMYGVINFKTGISYFCCLIFLVVSIAPSAPSIFQSRFYTLLNIAITFFFYFQVPAVREGEISPMFIGPASYFPTFRLSTGLQHSPRLW